MRKRRGWISSLIGLSLSLGCAASPAAAELKIDPSAFVLPSSVIQVNPAIKDIVTFQNSGDVQLKWKAPTLAALFSGGLAAGPDQSLYLGYTFPYILTVVHAVTAFQADGTKKWTFVLDQPILTPAVVGPDGTVYAGTGKENRSGELVAIKPDGTKKWGFGAVSPFRSAPVFGPDGTVYAASQDGIIHALNPQDGSELWWLDIGVQAKASLAVGTDGTIIATNGTSTLYAFKPNGTVKWTYEAGGVLNGAPAVDSGGVVYAGSADRSLYAVSPAGTKKWAYDLGSAVFAPTVATDGGIVYVGSEDFKLSAVSAEGKLKWQFAAGGSATPPVVGPNALVYTHSSSNKAIYALGPDGVVRWQYKFDTDQPLPLAVGRDGTLYDISTRFPQEKDIDSQDLEHTFVVYMYALKVPVKTVTLNETALSLTEGQTSALTASVMPGHASNPHVVWKSSNPNIASVDENGSVTARIAGTVVVTASSGDGPSVSCKVTVVSMPQTRTEVSSVALSKQALFLRAGDSAQLAARIVPDNATNRNVSWASSEAAVAAVNASGKVTAVSAGSADITVKTEDGQFTAKSKVVVTPGVSADNGPYTDIAGNWAVPEILRALELKVASGYPDFTFRPDATITRSEFSVMLMNGLKPALETAPLAFGDAEQIEDWAAASVGKAVKLGIINGYPDGTFRPAANITHAEMMSMAVKALGIAPPPGAASDYADEADIPDWAKPAAAVSGNLNLLGGTTGNRFAPSSLSTRAEAAAAIVRLLEVKP